MTKHFAQAIEKIIMMGNGADETYMSAITKIKAISELTGMYLLNLRRGEN